MSLWSGKGEEKEKKEWKGDGEEERKKKGHSFIAL